VEPDIQELVWMKHEGAVKESTMCTTVKGNVIVCYKTYCLNFLAQSPKHLYIGLLFTENTAFLYFDIFPKICLKEI